MFSRTSAVIEGFVANSPIGSPGANAKIRKMTMLMAINVGIAVRTRLTRYEFISVESH
jgi:hypothetical protein